MCRQSLWRPLTEGCGLEARLAWGVVSVILHTQQDLPTIKTVLISVSRVNSSIYQRREEMKKSTN